MTVAQIVAVSLYAVLALGTVSILWRNRFTPFDRRLRGFHVPELDDRGVVLHNSSDVGVI